MIKTLIRPDMGRVVWLLAGAFVAPRVISRLRG
jgi:hypothetical protein